MGKIRCVASLATADRSYCTASTHSICRYSNYIQNLQYLLLQQLPLLVRYEALCSEIAVFLRRFSETASSSQHGPQLLLFLNAGSRNRLLHGGT